MNTPSHYIINLALLGTTVAPQQTVAITLGAITPDLPIFIFYGVAKFVQQLPEKQIWTEAYYQPFWQTLVSLFHSFPLALLGLGVCVYFSWQWGAIFFGSFFLHSCFDLPVHHDDAHRHFFPLSDYRFISPVSYWDPKHYGTIAALVELLLVLAVTPLVFKLLNRGWSKAILLAINGLYAIAYFRFYIMPKF